MGWGRGRDGAAEQISVARNKKKKIIPCTLIIQCYREHCIGVLLNIKKIITLSDPLNLLFHDKYSRGKNISFCVGQVFWNMPGGVGQ